MVRRKGKYQYTEYQVVLRDGDDIYTDLTFVQARKMFRENPEATELRKVVWWKLPEGDHWGEYDREDITIAEREWDYENNRTYVKEEGNV